MNNKALFLTIQFYKILTIKLQTTYVHNFLILNVGCKWKYKYYLCVNQHIYKKGHKILDNANYVLIFLELKVKNNLADKLEFQAIRG